jgi:hypothetical protein
MRRIPDEMERIMKSLGLAVVAFGLMIAASGQAQASLLLSLTDAPGQMNTPYTFTLTATDTTTSFSFAGYQVPSFEDASMISVTTGGGSNLLGATWAYTPAASGSDSYTYPDGTSVPALSFGCITAGDYDTYTQTISSFVGEVFVLSFLYSNPDTPLNAPSGFIVSTSAAPVVPEPSSLALTSIAGLIGLGITRLRRKRAVVA